MHHWLIPQREWGRIVPNWIKNQPWNLMPMRSAVFHDAIHGTGKEAFTLLERIWYGSPTWSKAFVGDGLGRWWKYWSGEQESSVAQKNVDSSDKSECRK